MVTSSRRQVEGWTREDRTAPVAGTLLIVCQLLTPSCKVTSHGCYSDPFFRLFIENTVYLAFNEKGFQVILINSEGNAHFCYMCVNSAHLYLWPTSNCISPMICNSYKPQINSGYSVIPHVKTRYHLLSVVSFGLSHFLNGKNKTHTQPLMVFGKSRIMVDYGTEMTECWSGKG